MSMQEELSILYKALVKYLTGYTISEFNASTFWGFHCKRLLFVLAGALIFYVVGYYIISYLTLKISKLLKGQAEITDIRIVIAYATIQYFY